MSARAPALLVACLLPLACTSTTAQVDDNAPEPDASAGGERDGEADGAAPQPAPEPGGRDLAAELPDCEASEGEFTSYCTNDGKLAGRWMPADTLRVPADVEIVFDAKGPDRPPQARLQIATRGDELYIKHVTCGACRRIIGRGFVGYPARMSAEQLREVQGRLGLAAELAPLTDTAAWAEYCRSEAGERALTQLVMRGYADGP